MSSTRLRIATELGSIASAPRRHAQNSDEAPIYSRELQAPCMQSSALQYNSIPSGAESQCGPGESHSLPKSPQKILDCIPKDRNDAVAEGSRGLLGVPSGQVSTQNRDKIVVLQALGGAACLPVGGAQQPREEQARAGSERPGSQPRVVVREREREIVTTRIVSYAREGKKKKPTKPRCETTTRRR